jgi:hypothetical protein
MFIFLIRHPNDLAGQLVDVHGVEKAKVCFSFAVLLALP